MSQARRLEKLQAQAGVCPRCGRGGEPARDNGVNLLHEALKHPDYLAYLEQRALEEDRGKPIEDVTEANDAEPDDQRSTP